MFIRSKVSLFLLMILMVQLGAFYCIGRFILQPSFASLEREEARKDVARCVEAIHREVRELGLFVEDWANWDDTYEFVEDGNNDYVKANLVRATFVNSNLHLLYIYSSSGRVVWGQVRAPESFRKIKLQEFPDEGLPPAHPLLRHESVDGEVQGIWPTSSGPMLIATRPILTSNEQGPMRGTVAMGRFVGEKEIAAWRRQTLVTFSLWPFDKNTLPTEAQEVFDEFAQGREIVFREAEGNILWVYTLIPGIEGKPSLLLRADVPRQISTRGKGTLFFFSVWSAATGIFAFVALWILVTVSVTAPLGELASWAKECGEGGSGPGQAVVRRRDEIGILAREFDQRVQKLAEAKRKLLDKSYYSGMAEMAGGMLHNIRNCLNPISGHLVLMHNEMAKAPLEKIDQAQRELATGDIAPERREDLSRYVTLAARKLCDVVCNARERLEALSRSVAEMERIMSHHDHLSRRKHTTEQIQLDELLREALGMIPADLCKDMTVEIRPEVRLVGAIKGYRVPLLEVLINVLTNAHEAIVCRGTKDGRIVISAQEVETGGGGVVHLRVWDNGVGIRPGEVERIFERGVSSKKEGASGFGLHWCANAMASMNGRIYAESPGTGGGAVVHIVVPRRQEETL